MCVSFAKFKQDSKQKTSSIKRNYLPQINLGGQCLFDREMNEI